ncbi:MAG: NAD(P)H-binding protein, partial [Candidatus Tectimicrobiota bacterium]
MIGVTGATGYIGSHAAAVLAEGGSALRALVRPPVGPEEQVVLQSLGAAVVPGEAADPEAMERACAGCRAVLHCVGGIQPPRPGDFHSLHEGPAEALARAAHRTGLERIVLVSVVGTTLEADNAYHRSKARAEAILASAAQTVTIVRPSLVYGRAGGLRDSKLMARLAAHLRAGRPLPLPSGGQSFVQPLFVGDLARALALSTAEGVGAGRTLELGGPERMTLRAWMERLAAVLGVRPRLFRLPRPFAVALATCVERVASSPPISVDQVRVMGHNLVAPLDGIEATY